ncbi:carbonic anhydrase family protein [Halobacillus salinarum]|uniref:carbonic anhydrase n=1 Tax=Halobacillus salinarum TaxID=2932257 RepID=A0ABY4END1_9BACI|nr:carbonic anhydrase family protein [Halobacillus salinarum]UOQ45969.1 carbonic anhydrase family protein [Halobacillus salinarum]
MKTKITNYCLTVLLSFSLGACSINTEQISETSERQRKEREDSKHAQWSYKGKTGPDNWGKTNPVNAACANGDKQSPINVNFSQVHKTSKKKNVQIQYEPSSVSILNNGHTVQADPSKENNTLIMNGKKYTLDQFHFHTPSEHKYNGSHYDMEMHFVHKDSKGKIAVLGVMIKKGKTNKNLSPVWESLPDNKTSEAVPIKEQINLQNVLPEEMNFLYYNGSLTTPPCTEGVKWILLKQPIEISDKQLLKFQKIFSDNHRPVEPLNGREILNTK